MGISELYLRTTFSSNENDRHRLTHSWFVYFHSTRKAINNHFFSDYYLAKDRFYKMMKAKMLSLTETKTNNMSFFQIFLLLVICKEAVAGISLASSIFLMKYGMSAVCSKEPSMICHVICLIRTFFGIIVRSLLRRERKGEKRKETEEEKTDWFGLEGS